MPPEYVHSVEKIGVVSVPFEDSEAADNKAHPSDHVGRKYCAGAAHCCSLDEHSDLPVPNLDLATGALGTSLVHRLGNAVTANVLGNGVVDDKVTHHPALNTTCHHSGEELTSYNVLIHTLTPDKDCKEASDWSGESATKDAVEVGGHGAAPGLLSDWL